jgi:bifunctional non-homologous end joining protein LigD
MTKKQQVKIDGRDLILTNAEKVYFPRNGFTKGEVIKFYSEIADTILPHLRGRPLTLKRYPDGITGEPFYEKNARHAPPWVETFKVPRSEGGGDINYILCNDRATLLWTTNLGDIEKHMLLAKAPELNRPTSVVFDLDPGEGVTILDCGKVALHLRDVFNALKLDSFVKVSGSKGLHLSVPLNTEVTYEMSQPFAKTIAELAEQQLPKQVVSAMAKTLRRGKVLIDWSQNSDFKTTVCVYAMRAKEGGPFISMPVAWEELAKAVKTKKPEALFFKPDAAVKRIKRLGDLFAPVLKLRQTLPAAFTKALAAGPPPRLSSWPRNRNKSGQDHDKSLREYAAKRDHTRTPEPAAKPVAKTATGTGVHRFVIQKHDASHLHYDWRLEMQGALRSWAVPKGPPLKLREARLAMHVEDHPLDYASFEGTIPPGNYGAGTVMVWDQGEYEDLTGNPAAAFHHGKMHVILRGKKLKGEWILVKDRREEGSNKWLLIKAGKPQTLTAKADDTSVGSPAKWPRGRSRSSLYSSRWEPSLVHPGFDLLFDQLFEGLVIVVIILLRLPLLRHAFDELLGHLHLRFADRLFRRLVEL